MKNNIMDLSVEGFDLICHCPACGKKIFHEDEIIKCPHLLFFLMDEAGGFEFIIDKFKKEGKIFIDSGKNVGDIHELLEKYESKNTVCFRIENICTDPRGVDVVTCIGFDYKI